MIRHPGPLLGLAAAGLLSLPIIAGPAPDPSPAAEPVPAAAPAPRAAETPALTLAAYQAQSASQWRNYDRTQDISLRQLMLLLEVAERTGTSLGQAIATGELESARTWNDHVRPTLRNGSLGAASGVWQFMPGTFHQIIRKYGDKLLSASAADQAAGRGPLDLTEGPFTDARVRTIIRETVDGKRGADDEELKLLRHNFAVLAFAKHYLSLDSGATTPEEDYLFHFLGATQGRRVLALARGEARDTLCVKLPPPAPPAPLEDPQVLPGPASDLLAGSAPPGPARTPDRLPAVPAVLAPPVLLSPPTPAPDATAAQQRTQARARSGTRDDQVARMRSRGAFEVIAAPVLSPIAPPPALSGLPAPALPGSAPVSTPMDTAPLPPPPSAEWGLPADAPTVTGNLGMFYRDGKGQSQPYTWGEFLENLARRVRAKDQPAMVRAKYGVGFGLKGGDLPERSFDPARPGDPVEFRSAQDRPVLVAEALILGPLERQEARRYKERLVALMTQGEDRPIATLTPEAVAALRGLRLLAPKVREPVSTDPQVQKALAAFRKKVGKDTPDDPAHRHLLMPAERIALEIYGQRLAHYADLQAHQQASLQSALDLNRVRKLPAGPQKRAAPQIAAVQSALAAQGLLTQPTKKVTWRDKKRRLHVEHRPAPFAGKADKATVGALNTFQLRHGLRKTEGVLDAVTLGLLGLSPLGPEVLRPLSGPQCEFDGWGEKPPMSAIPSPNPAPNPAPNPLPTQAPPQAPAAVAPLPPRVTRKPGLYYGNIRAAAPTMQPPVD